MVWNCFGDVGGVDQALILCQVCQGLCREMFTSDTVLGVVGRSENGVSVCKLLFLLDRDIHIKKKKKRKRGACVSVSDKIGINSPARFFYALARCLSPCLILRGSPRPILKILTHLTQNSVLLCKSIG